ncbi:MAG TPA: hypothetical protein VLE19_09850 [Pyrinomonadaceae bacterium]|nr:hypothetical protein [Pyrinomonadaceae bacterium]
MRVKVTLLSLLFCLTAITNVSAKDAGEILALKAASGNAAEAAVAIDELRLAGPAGMRVLMNQYAEEIARRITNPTSASSPEWLRISAALDAVSQQRNSYLSGLYWYTDLTEARKASARTGKPILSLRLLGKLTDDLSCANSRFFRTVLYSNATISATLRDHFVLHWQTFRPVPLITIDFGNGRKLVRTITGNSIHYILDSDGQVIEALPGLYGPAAFARRLGSVEVLFATFKGKSEFEKRGVLAEYYRSLNNKISVAWLTDINKLGGKKPEGVSVLVDEKGEALSIMPLAVSKAITEATVLRAMTAGSEALGRITDEDTWKQIAALHRSDALLDEQSLSLIRKQNPDLSATEIKNLIDRFQNSVALDTVRNEYRMHTRLLAWLTNNSLRADVDKFNEKVYAELFFTPKSDPWLGLLMADTYTAIDNSGVVKGNND